MVKRVYVIEVQVSKPALFDEVQAAMKVAYALLAEAYPTQPGVNVRAYYDDFHGGLLRRLS